MLILELHVNFNFAMPAVSARGALLVSSPRKTYEVQHLSEWAGGGPDTYTYAHRCGWEDPNAQLRNQWRKTTTLQWGGAH